ncbi:MAG: hypothetical protein QG604_82 [Candidatus Dependentiae bacterium]|nr:hypothetical protein [Candidatus Dependentiae bacterium]
MYYFSMNKSFLLFTLFSCIATSCFGWVPAELQKKRHLVTSVGLMAAQAIGLRFIDQRIAALSEELDYIGSCNSLGNDYTALIKKRAGLQRLKKMLMGGTGAALIWTVYLIAHNYGSAAPTTTLGEVPQPEKPSEKPLIRREAKPGDIGRTPREARPPVAPTGEVVIAKPDYAHKALPETPGDRDVILKYNTIVDRMNAFHMAGGDAKSAVKNSMLLKILLGTEKLPESSGKCTKLILAYAPDKIGRYFPDTADSALLNDYYGAAVAAIDREFNTASSELGGHISDYAQGEGDLAEDRDLGALSMDDI